MSDKTALTPDQILAEELADWRYMLRTLRARFVTGDFNTGAQFVSRIAEAADAMDHHPDVDLRYFRVDIVLTSHDTDAVTSRDIRLARTISQFAAQLGAKAATDQVQMFEIALDTPDHEAVKPFWRALLGYSDSPRPDEILDRGGRYPALWFQETTRHEPPQQRFHFDVHVPPEQADARVSAALEAGGMLVDDTSAPSFWVLADPDGNRACVCTWQQPGAEPA